MMMSISISLNILKSLDSLKKSGGSKGIVDSYLIEGTKAIVVVSMPVRALNKNASNAFKNRATTQLLVTLGTWVNSELSTLQKAGITEVRLEPVVESFQRRLNGQASSGKFNLEFSSNTEQGITSELKLVQWTHTPGDHFLHLYLPKPIKAEKTSKEYLADIRNRLRK